MISISLNICSLIDASLILSWSFFFQRKFTSSAHYPIYATPSKIDHFSLSLPTIPATQSTLNELSSSSSSVEAATETAVQDEKSSNNKQLHLNFHFTNFTPGCLKLLTRVKRPSDSLEVGPLNMTGWGFFSYKDCHRSLTGLSSREAMKFYWLSYRETFDRSIKK